MKIDEYLEQVTVVHIDMDDTIFDYSGARDEALRNCPEIAYPQSQIDFFRNLKLIPGAKETIEKLFHRVEIYFLTAPSTKNPFSYTEKCLSLKDNFGQWAVERLFICPDKSLVRGHYLIDDITAGKGQEMFGGELIQFGSGKYPNWEAIAEYFRV